MNIPDSVRIGGVDYSIVYKERIISGEGKALLGQIDFDNSRILIEPSVQSLQGQHQTLLHEIMHGIEHHFKMDLTEDEIDNLANGVYMVAADNPDIFK